MALPRNRWVLWLGCVLTVVVAAGITVPIIVTSSPDDSGDSDDSPESEHAVATSGSTSPAPDLDDWSVSGEQPDGDHGFASWTVDDNLIWVGSTEVLALSRDDGTKAWSVTPPGDGNVFCGTTDRVSESTIALAYGDQIHEDQPPEWKCDHATLLDLSSGEFGDWKQNFKTPQDTFPDEDPASAMLSIADDVVVIAQEQGRAGLDAETGEKLWSKHIHDEKTDDKSCEAYDLASHDDKAVITHTCLGADNADAANMSIIDPKSGKLEQQRAYTTNGSLELPRIASTEPFVLTFKNVLDIDDNLFYGILGKDHKIASGFMRGPMGTSDGLAFLPLGFTGITKQTVHRKMRTLVTDDTLYTVTEVRPEEANVLLAYDLRSGQLKWDAELADTWLLKPLSVTAGKLVVAAGPTDDAGPMRIVRADSATGAVTSDKKYHLEPEEAETSMLQEYEFHWSDGRVYGIRGQGSNYSVDAFAYGG